MREALQFLSRSTSSGGIALRMERGALSYWERLSEV